MTRNQAFYGLHLAIACVIAPILWLVYSATPLTEIAIAASAMTAAVPICLLGMAQR